jgi:protein arginine kinase
MRLADLTERAGEWLRVGGPMHDVVISSRIRLARNVAGMPFLTRSSPEQLLELQARLREALLGADLAEEMLYVDLSSAGALDRRLLVERQLISRQHAEGKHPRGVAIAGSETLSVMVNEEDHLRIQVLRSGLQLEAAAAEMHRLDERLEERLDFAFHSRYGYLTACPTNVGTGMRASVMLHLPALKMTGEIEKAFRAARDMRLTIRGLFGEGTEASGDFFQVSNQTTLGKSEKQLVQELLEECVPNFIQYERHARSSLLRRRSLAVDDKVLRALAILRAARLVSSEETMYLLSLVRLGVNLGRLQGVDLKTINELFLLTQPAHLQKIHGREMTPRERAEVRAAYIRRRLGAV